MPLIRLLAQKPVGPMEILLVEDSAADVLLTEEAFQAAKVLNRLSVVRDGVEAMDFLRHRGQYTMAPRPDLILLDLNLPRKNGRAVLAEIKADPVLRRIPVVILTTSAAAEDVLKSYDLHSNSYIIKPVALAQFVHVLRLIEDYWLTIVKLPSEEWDGS
jgi:chemotaxis family two-component system response regulator Rcp1